MSLIDLEEHPSFVARWDYPHWVLSEDLDASRAAKVGAPKKQSNDKILNYIPLGEDNAIFFNQLNIDISKQQFNRRRQEIDHIKVVKMINSAGKLENAFYK